MDAVRFLPVDTPLTYGRTAPHSGRVGDALVNFANTRTRQCVAIGAILSLPAVIIIYVLSQFHPYLDFHVYLLGARHVFDPDLYTVRLQRIPYLPFTYPPIAALFFWPFTLVPSGLATFLWATLILASLVLLIRLSLRLARPDFTPQGLWAATLLLVGPAFAMEPIWENFQFGQINLVLAMFVLYDVLERPNRRLPRGIMLGLATAIKLVPFVFIAYLVLRRQFRAALVALTTVVAAEAFMLLVNYHVTILYWRQYAFNAQHIGTVWYNSNQSIRGASQRLAHELLSHGLLTAFEALTILVGLCIAVALAPHVSQIATLVAVGMTGDLASPISWTHHLVWLIPLLVWLTIAHDRPRTGPWWALLVVSANWYSFVWIPPENGMDPLHWNLLNSVLGNVDFFIMVAALAAIGVLGWQRRKDPAALLQPAD